MCMRHGIGKDCAVHIHGGRRGTRQKGERREASCRSRDLARSVPQLQAHNSIIEVHSF